MKKLLFLVIPLIALLGGAFAGNILREPPPPVDTDPSEQPDGTTGEQPIAATSDLAGDISAEDIAWFSFPHQFFVPLMRGGQAAGTMILTVTLETPKSAEETIREQEPRLRDAILRALMAHANSGGFDGNFTTEFRMERLRQTLLATAREVAGNGVSDVLIQDLLRQ